MSGPVFSTDEISALMALAVLHVNPDPRYTSPLAMSAYYKARTVVIEREGGARVLPFEVGR